MKLCKDCKFFTFPTTKFMGREYRSSDRPMCLKHGQPNGEYYVFGKGEKIRPAHYCSVERSYTHDDLCGPDAKNFESREGA